MFLMKKELLSPKYIGRKKICSIIYFIINILVLNINNNATRLDELYMNYITFFLKLYLLG